MQILIATGNPHKREEIQAIFEAEAKSRAGGGSDPRGIEWLTLSDLQSVCDEPVEDGHTFEANARIKAEHYAVATRRFCLADDSGLEVDALEGAPGVRSARYSETTGDREQVDRANNRKLLENLAGVDREQRTARFVCAMVLAAPPMDELPANLPAAWRRIVQPADVPQVMVSLRGTVEGRIIEPHEAADPSQPERGRGTNGFGYDPLFYVPELGCTTAELAAEQKNQVSHRGQAARALHQHLHESGLV